MKITQWLLILVFLPVVLLLLLVVFELLINIHQLFELIFGNRLSLFYLIVFLTVLIYLLTF